MSVNSENSGDEDERVFELKAATFTLPILRLLDNDMDAIGTKLGAKVESAPDFFRHTPIVIDLSGLPEGAGADDFPLLVGLLRGYGMIPFGVRGGNKAQNAAAEALELAILRDAYVRRAKPAEPTDPAESAQVDLDPASSSLGAGPSLSRSGPATRRQNPGFMLVTRPVRSGQRIYASGGDLSVIAAVSSGAELMADGNIHVYGALRGRALAGMNGNLEARIFCQELRAELVSIAGHYRVSENIPAELRGFPVQIFLDQKIIRIEKL